VNNNYLMESNLETVRLEAKTDLEKVKIQAIWAGIQPGMRVADVCCGPGKTTKCLNHLVQPGGSTCGIDISEERINYANKINSMKGIEFICADIRTPLEKLGLFDFVWIRFALEYFRKDSFEIVKNLSALVKKGGILCLIDLDNNCLSHFGFPSEIENTIAKIVKRLEENHNFDPYVGRKLYSFLYDLEFKEINLSVSAHHLIFGKLNENDAFNWIQKVKIAAKFSGYNFSEYAGGYEEFSEKFVNHFANPRRFTYTPVICCRGQKPF